MTTIKSVSGAAAINVDQYRDGTTDVAASRGAREVFRGIFITADLLAALEATANTEIPLALDRLRDKWMDEWKARAEKAEAAIQRVRDVRNEWSKTLGRSGRVVEIDDALADKPAFTLPTEAGARFEARMKQDPDEWRTFITFDGGVNGALYSYFDAKYGWYTYDVDDVLAQFTDHRLIGAES